MGGGWGFICMLGKCFKRVWWRRWGIYRGVERFLMGLQVLLVYIAMLSYPCVGFYEELGYEAPKLYWLNFRGYMLLTALV